AGSAGPLVDEIGNHLSPVVSFDTVNSLYFCAFDDTRLATSDNPGDVRFNRFSTSFVKQESPSVLLTRGANDQNFPDAAWNGTDWLVAWSDARGADADVWAVRVDPTGAVLDANGIQIESQANAQATPRVTSDGTNWLVVWLNGTAVDAVRVGPGGAIVDA